MKSPDRIVKNIAPTSVFDDVSALVSSAISFNQGDLIEIDTSGHLVGAIGGSSTGQYVLGISRVTVVSGVVKQPYSTENDAAIAAGKIPGPVSGVVVKLVSKTADAWVPGQDVYPYGTGGAYYVTTSGSKSIGIYQGPTIASAAAGQEIEVMLGHRYPGDTLVL